MNSAQKKELEELYKNEKEIKKKLVENTTFKGTYKEYYLLDYACYKKYKVYLNNLVYKGKYTPFKYDESLEATTEDKFFFFSEKELDTFHFISNFIIVNKKFMELLSKNYKNKNQLLESFSSIILGGQCMIRKDGNNDCNHYITYYEEDKNNNVDFYTKINDIEQIKIHLNLILNHNLWFY